MRRRLVTLAAVAAIVGFSVVPGQAFWTFLAHGVGTDYVHCSGEPNQTYGQPICEIITSWGDEVSTYEDSGLCTARIRCGDIYISCSAVETWGQSPAVCGAFARQGYWYYAVCKSDSGFYHIDCSDA
jgi:hypothetical protein